MTLVETSSPKSVVIVAGEASGDLHGAHVVTALRKRYPGIKVHGAGGRAMLAAGAELAVKSETLSVMGFTAVFAKIPVILRAMARLRRLLDNLEPDLLILIDFPDFNLHLAAYARKRHIPVLYYISPQVWAWRPGRIREIKARVNHMAVILPFEKSIYEKHGVPVTFVGHPLLDDEIAFRPASTKNTGRTDFSIALLPGSREGEINRLLPPMLRSAEIVQREISAARFIISCAPSINRKLIDQVLDGYHLDNTEVVTCPVADIFDRCRLAIITSGTASLEAAVYGRPLIIVYKTSHLNYLLGKLLIRVPHIGLANLIAQKRIVPELVQTQASAENIAAAALELLNNPDAYDRMRAELSAVKRRMGSPGASDRVAEIAGRLMED